MLKKSNFQCHSFNPFGLVRIRLDVYTVDLYLRNVHELTYKNRHILWIGLDQFGNI
jgi:hypothetical protein